MKKSQWHADEKYEKVLRDAGLKFDCSSRVPIKQINLKASMDNPGRMKEKFNTDTVDDYAEAMKRGASFPYVVCVETDNGLELLTGVQRTMAAEKAKRRYIGMYIITKRLTLGEFRILAINLNRVEGDRATKEDALIGAMALVMQDNWAIPEAANLFCVPVATLRGRIRANQTRLAATQEGFRGTLPMAAWAMLGKLSTNKKVLTVTAQLIANNKVPTNKIAVVIKQVLLAPNEQTQLKIAKKIATEVGEARFSSGRANATVKFRIKKRFVRAFHDLMNVVTQYTTVEKLQIARGSDEHKALKNDLPKLIKGLKNALK